MSDFSAHWVMESAWPAVAGDGWGPCLTTPLPLYWPPLERGVVVWYCYAQRMQPGLMDGVEISAPWARLILQNTEVQPALQRLTEVIEPLGIQGVRPIDPAMLRTAPLSQPLSQMIQRGQTCDHEAIAKALNGWREFNGRIASHPAVAAHFSPK